MSDNDQTRKRTSTTPSEKADVEAPAEQGERDGLLEDVDELLDEIDEVLEENAEEFIKNYVQKGGQ